MRMPIEHILVYLDGTDESVTAAQYAITLAKSTGAKLSALFIVNTRALDDLLKTHIFVAEEQSEYRKELASDAGKYLNLVARMAEKKGQPVSLHEENGAVQSVVKSFIREQDVDLLVTGKISRIRSRRDELNNDTDRLVRNVSCAVLIVKDEERVWDLFEEEDE